MCDWKSGNALKRTIFYKLGGNPLWRATPLPLVYTWVSEVKSSLSRVTGERFIVIFQQSMDFSYGTAGA